MQGPLELYLAEARGKIHVNNNLAARPLKRMITNLLLLTNKATKVACTRHETIRVIISLV